MNQAKSSGKKAKKNKKDQKSQKTSNDSHKQMEAMAADSESEREAVVYVKRGERRKQLLSNDSSKISIAKQSLLDAREPDPDALSRASYLLSHELSSDRNSSARKPRDFGVQEIVNLHTNNGGK